MARRRECLGSETLSVVRVPGNAASVVQLIRNYRGQFVWLTDERLAHILRQHPEAARLGLPAIEDALRHPDLVIVSPAAPNDHLYYRHHRGADFGDKFLCIVVKSIDAFVVTAYVTARRKKGVQVWPKTT